MISTIKFVKASKVGAPEYLAETTVVYHESFKDLVWAVYFQCILFKLELAAINQRGVEITTDSYDTLTASHGLVVIVH